MSPQSLCLTIPFRTASSLETYPILFSLYYISLTESISCMNLSLIIAYFHPREQRLGPFATKPSALITVPYTSQKDA